MLKLLGLIVKLTLFTIAVLLAGSWIHWDGRSLSEHVMAQAHRAERSSTAESLRDLTRSLADDARNGFEKKQHSQSRSRIPATTHSAPDVSDRTVSQAAAAAHLSTADGEKLPPSERQKLRALIRELNSGR